VIDWGGKVAAWFFGVGGFALAMALYLGSAVQPWRGWRHDLVDALLCVAAACMIGCLLTGPAAIASLVRRKRLKKRERALHVAAAEPDLAEPVSVDHEAQPIAAKSRPVIDHGTIREQTVASETDSRQLAKPGLLTSRSESKMVTTTQLVSSQLHRHRGFKGRHLAVAAVVVLALGGLSILGIFLDQGGGQHARKLVTPPLAVPPGTSKIEICHQNGNELYALTMPSNVIINLGVANVSAGATKWGLTANAAYTNQNLSL